MASSITAMFSSIKSLFFEENEEDFFKDTAISNPPPKPVLAHDVPLSKKTGTITTIDRNYVLIDNCYGYQMPEINDKLQVGSQVEFTVAHLENGGCPVVNLKLSEETIEESAEWANHQATVTSINGRDVYLSNSMTCNLDHAALKRGYTVAVGDRIIYEIEIIRGQEVIAKLQPNFEQTMKGYISEIDGFNGLIKSKGEDIWFTGDVLPKNYNPLKGDYVKVTAILSDCPGKAGKRAIDVQLIDNQKVFEPGEEQQISDVAISMVTDFKTVALNDNSKFLILSIKNTGSEMLTLLKGSFRRPQSQISVSGFSFPKTLAPLTHCSIQFDLRPKFIGMNSETYDFYFNGFRISRTFHVMVRAEFFEDINFQPGKYQFPERKERTCHSRETSTYGVTPFSKKHFRTKRLRYIVPKKLSEITSKNDRRDQKRLLEEECPVLPQCVTSANYGKKFHLLLFLEQAYQDCEFSKLRRDHQFFKRVGDLMRLNMPGVLEKRPSPIVGDKVIVTQPWLNDSTSHVGFIHNIAKDTIFVDFNETFRNNYAETDCTVEFEAQKGSINMMHHAVDQALLKLVGTVLFPVNLKLKSPWYSIEKEDIGWYNKNLNEFQKNAVVNVLRGRCRPFPYVIFGPPGTGKTSTVTELILQIMRYADSKILVTAPSNSAANLLTKRLIQYGRLEPRELVRILAFSKAMEPADEEIEDYCSTANEEANKSSTALGYHKITVGTCLSIGFFDENVQFSHIIIDEAGCASEPQTLVPMMYLQNNGLTVLTGDPKQLGPTMIAAAVRDYGLSDSLLLRIMNTEMYSYDAGAFPETDGYNPNVVTCLKINYRSVPDILAVPNRLFYNSTLQATISDKTGRESEIIKGFAKKCPIRDEPASLIFHGIRGKNYQEADSPSWLNPEEICQAYIYVKKLLDMGVLPVEIGIISPYNKQVQKLREIIMKLQKIDTIKVGSVEEFQGQERMVIIVSVVRSSPAYLSQDQLQLLGFLVDPRRFNVAITRARALLIVLGNPHLLANDTYWRELIKYCLEAGTYTGCDAPESLVRYSVREKKPKKIEVDNKEVEDVDARHSPVASEW